MPGTIAAMSPNDVESAFPTCGADSAEENCILNDTSSRTFAEEEKEEVCFGGPYCQSYGRRLSNDGTSSNGSARRVGFLASAAGSKPVLCDDFDENGTDDGEGMHGSAGDRQVDKPLNAHPRPSYERRRSNESTTSTGSSRRGNILASNASLRSTLMLRELNVRDDVEEGHGSAGNGQTDKPLDSCPPPAYERRRSNESMTSTSSARRGNILVSADVSASAMILRELSQLDDFNDDGSDVDEEEHDSAGQEDKPLYAHPRQRQRWGEDQVLPHINWGDLFFDLFYVGAAYNLGVLLLSALTPDLYLRGILYFVGIFGPLINIWEGKLFIAAEYCASDYAHEIIEIVRVCFLGFSVLHITTIDRMSDPHRNDMFYFALGVFLEKIVNIILQVELFFVGEGDVEAIKNHSRHEILVSFLPQALLFLSATLVAGIQHSQASTRDYNNSWKAADDAPIIICLVAYIINSLVEAIRKVWVLPRSQDFRKYNVPSNVDFIIHRYGEWTMLMLGEAVLSLLIAMTPDDSTSDYYAVVLTGILTVIMLQFLKFESEPCPSGHAIWRNMTSGFLYSSLVQILSIGLVAFGLSFKAMLKTIYYEVSSNTDNTYSGLMKDNELGYGNTHVVERDGDGGYDTEYGEHRLLASGGTKTTHEANAGLYCGSLTIVLVALDLMAMSHRGIVKNFNRVFRPSKLLPGEMIALSTNTAASGWSKLIIAIKVCLFIFTATMSLWLTDPVHVSVAGLSVVASFAVLSKLWRNCVGSLGRHPKKKRGKASKKTSSARTEH